MRLEREDSLRLGIARLAFPKCRPEAVDPDGREARRLRAALATLGAIASVALDAGFEAGQIESIRLEGTRRRWHLFVRLSSATASQARQRVSAAGFRAVTTAPSPEDPVERDAVATWFALCSRWPAWSAAPTGAEVFG